MKVMGEGMGDFGLMKPSVITFLSPQRHLVSIYHLFCIIHLLPPSFNFFFHYLSKTKSSSIFLVTFTPVLASISLRDHGLEFGYIFAPA